MLLSALHTKLHVTAAMQLCASAVALDMCRHQQASAIIETKVFLCVAVAIACAVPLLLLHVLLLGSALLLQLPMLDIQGRLCRCFGH